MSIDAYLKRTDAEKILLVEIDPGGTPRYLADTVYISEPGDAPANQPYAPVIADNGVPRLSRKIPDLWGGRAITSWGDLELATQFVNGEDLAVAALRGLPYQALITGPRQHVARADAMVIQSGVISLRSGNADGGLSIEILDNQNELDNTSLPANSYDVATEGANFPANNHGLSKPLCLGKCRNVPAVLIDASAWVYQINDAAYGAVQAVDAVYDQGVSVAFTADLTAGTFTLSANPVGMVTADVQGLKDGATYLSTTQQIIEWLADQASISVFDITGLPTDTVGLYLNIPTRASDVITKLMRGVLGWWGFTRTGAMKARLIAAPVSGGPSFSEVKHLSDVTWTEDDDVVWSVPLLYRRNWQRVEPASSVTLDQATWLRSDGNQHRVQDSNIQTSYPYAVVADPLETYFDAQAAATTVANRALTLFGQPRKTARVTLPVTSPLLQLGDSVNLSDADVLDGDHLAVGVTDVWAGEIPAVDVELWR